jgi:hypothetical protein
MNLRFRRTICSLTAPPALPDKSAAINPTETFDG